MKLFKKEKKKIAFSDFVNKKNKIMFSLKYKRLEKKIHSDTGFQVKIE